MHWYVALHTHSSALKYTKHGMCDAPRRGAGDGVHDCYEIAVVGCGWSTPSDLLLLLLAHSALNVVPDRRCRCLCLFNPVLLHGTAVVWCRWVTCDPCW